MKLSIDNNVLELSFTNNKIIGTIELTSNVIAATDINKMLVNLNVSKYSVIRKWTNELLKENNLPLLEDNEIPFYLHHGYQCAFFRLEDIDQEEIVCYSYLEGENLIRTTVKSYLQGDIDYNYRIDRMFPKSNE